MILPLAHVGHWLVSVAYLVPVLAFGAWLAIQWVRGRRSEPRMLAEPFESIASPAAIDQERGAALRADDGTRTHDLLHDKQR